MSNKVFNRSDVEYLNDLASRLENGLYRTNPQWIRDLAERVDATVTELERQQHPPDAAAVGAPPSGVIDSNGVEVKAGDTLIEQDGLIKGIVRFERGAFRVQLIYVGNPDNKHGWGLRKNNSPLGDYLVYDRVTRYGATVERRDALAAG